MLPVSLWPARSRPSLPVPLAPLPVPVVRPSRPEAVAKLKALEVSMVAANLPPLDIDKSTNHFFADGLYARQWTQPAGTLATSKTHAKENFLVLLTGQCAISDGEVNTVYSAPAVVKTMPGVKRAVLALTDIVIMTFHPNPDNETDMTILEDRYIIPETFPQRPAVEYK